MGSAINTTTGEVHHTTPLPIADEAHPNSPPPTATKALQTPHLTAAAEALPTSPIPTHLLLPMQKYFLLWSSLNLSVQQNQPEEDGRPPAERR